MRAALIRSSRQDKTEARKKTGRLLAAVKGKREEEEEVALLLK
jgi:hypothetical protein